MATVAAVLQRGVDAARAQAEQHLFVITAQGQVYAPVQAGIASFKGIPYAAPPIGDWRWRAPQPAASRSDILVADAYGARCLQPSRPDAPRLEPAGEDCLTLNIFRPFQVDDPLPVMVWFHGGSFADGAGGDPLYDGSRLAEEGVVVVTFNYRLGPLGWLTHPLLSHDPAGREANIGMMDQIAALHWVADNIAAFGGDAGNVTLFGDTAGGTSVAMLMASDAAVGLFQKAIIQSAELRAPARSLAETEAAGNVFFQALGLDPGADEDLSKPRELSSERLLAAETMLLDARRIGFSPTLDGDRVKESIASAFVAGHQRRIPLIVGANADETVRFPEFGRESNIDAKLANETIDLLKSLYPEAGSDRRHIAAKLFTDRTFVEPARLIARAHAERDAPTYRYHFSYRPQGSPRGNPASGPEVEFVFGTLGVETAGLFTYKDRETSEIMRAYWTNFAKRGDPNGPGLPAWPRYSAAEPVLMISNSGFSADRDPWTARLDRLEQQSESR